MGSYIPLFKSFFQIIFSLLFKASYYKIIDRRIVLSFLLKIKLSNLESDSTVALGYLNLALNNLGTLTHALLTFEIIFKSSSLNSFLLNLLSPEII